MRLVAWRGAGHGLVFAALLVGGCSAPEAPAPERPALRFAHNLWPGYFPITLARELGYCAREGADVEVIYREEQEPQIADFIAGKYDGMALPIGSLIVASAHHPDLRVVYAIDESAGGDAVVAKPAITGIAELRGKVIGTKLGGFGELFVERMLQAGGLTRAEVTLINTASPRAVARRGDRCGAGLGAVCLSGGAERRARVRANSFAEVSPHRLGRNRLFGFRRMGDG